MLKRNCYIFSFIIIYAPEILSEVWLVPNSKYRYSSSISNVDNSSVKQQHKRADLYLKIQRKLESLRENIKKLNKNSAFYRSLFNQIQALEKVSMQLPSYQDESIKTFAIEYGVNNNQNFGIKLLYEENIFQNNKEIKNKSTTEAVDLFYKIKFFQKNNFIVSIQPKISVIKDSDYKKQFFYELSLLSGFSQDTQFISLFTENTLSLAQSLNDVGKKKKYYAFSASEGIKFKNGIMLINFTKYFIRYNYGLIYNKTLYTQLSVANQIKFTNLRENSFTIQIGYFWDQSLSNRNYKISGTIFSVWLDI